MISSIFPAAPSGAPSSAPSTASPVGSRTDSPTNQQPGAFIVPAQAPQQVIAPTHMINAAPQQPAQMLAQQQQPAVQIINPAPLQQQAVMPTIAGAPAAAKLTPKVARGPDDSNLIVNYIPVELTDEALASLFGQHGKVTNCRIMRDAKGVGKGFGFVKFEDVDAAMKCIEEMNGHEVYGKRLRVNIARPDKGQQTHNHPHFKHVQAMKQQQAQMQQMHPMQYAQPMYIQQAPMAAHQALPQQPVYIVAPPHQQQQQAVPMMPPQQQQQHINAPQYMPHVMPPQYHQ